MILDGFGQEVPAVPILDLDPPDVRVVIRPFPAVRINLILRGTAIAPTGPHPLAPFVSRWDKEPDICPPQHHLHEHSTRIFVSAANHISGRES